MAETVIIASVTLIFLLILIQKISVRFLFYDKLSAEIDYSFFTLVLSDFKKGGKSEKFSPKLFPEIRRAIGFLLKKSEISISEIKINARDTDPQSFIIKYKNLFSLFAALTVYLSKKTKKLSLNDSSLEVLGDGGDGKHSFDISIKAPLYVALSAAAMFFFIRFKNKRIIKS